MTTTQRILWQAHLLRCARTAPTSVRHAQLAIEEIVAAAGELSEEHVKELERLAEEEGESNG